jgi:gluconokinase
VIACSALKRAYRDILVHGRADVRIVFLDGTQQLIASPSRPAQGPFHAAGSAGRASSKPSSRRTRVKIP